ncbi:unnamed protein product [Gulo gulo]|uniref:Uncharacterized protein n=1 Tax=Gulo gulo TaxID=48420 RepID=A0A9X9LWZ6_GULGU|nr:unnamed protein product [Gulo gulo]
MEVSAQGFQLGDLRFSGCLLFPQHTSGLSVSKRARTEELSR